jgi:uncharacterized protein (DUF1499 family)
VRRGRIVIPVVVAVSLLSCAGKRPANLGVSGGALAACPASPNCVSSDAGPTDSAHAVEAFALAVPAERAWPAVVEAVSALPRTTIVTKTADYLHAECRSALFRFVDDLELYLRPSQGTIAVRSASRIGYSDLGVNRRRVESLREALREQGVVR